MSTPVLPGEAFVVVAGLAALVAANAIVLRYGLAPLHRLGEAMDSADLLRPGARAEVAGPAETARLITTYNAMLDRLAAERAAGAARALRAQEHERRRVARELHDEVGQTLTAVLLQLKRVADRAPADLRDDVTQVQEATRAGLDEIRRIARRLRPGVLEELGLPSALRALAAEFTGPGLAVRTDLAPALPPLPADTELVLYRVAQEALTNTARHAGAARARIALRADAGGTVELLVRDDGTGLGEAPEGGGISGMRERALLVGADFTVAPAPGGGTDVRLRIPGRRVGSVAPRRGDEVRRALDGGAARRLPPSRRGAGGLAPAAGAVPAGERPRSGGGLPSGEGLLSGGGLPSGERPRSGGGPSAGRGCCPVVGCRRGRGCCPVGGLPSGEGLLSGGGLR
ncbi:hypothetical protein GCM10020256_18170 [Streptomyces thermocoprophilus]